jgi:enoyl-[acyl-carrier protein] reductase III
MSHPLSGQTALITGSSRGIGKAIALELASLGADIAVNFVRNEEEAARTVAQIQGLGRRAFAVQANVGNPSDLDRLTEETLKEFGHLDILVHNAALGAFKPVSKLRVNQWDLSMEINTKALLLLTQKFLPSMEARGGGRIIALSSLGAHRFIPNYGAIGVSKSALETLVKYLAVELAPKNIRVNAVSGGLVDTDALKSFPDYEKFKEEVLKRTPAGRIGKPEDLAKVVAYLTTGAANWIYGQTIVADGGLSLI